MTVGIRSRRLLRSVAVVAACCVWIPTLVLVTAAPAHAANTASELLVDPAQRATPLDSGVRPFGGNDRYATAVRVAERYAHEQGGLDAVSTVILASGETPIDGAPAAGLAARHKAPILLTRPTGLPGVVADFIVDHNVSDVIVVGGESSVSAGVLEEIAALETITTTRRIAGADRYATAAAIAAELDTMTNWCGTNDTVALLANGGSEFLGHIVATGPLVYAMELPVLLTERTELPRVTAEALDRKGIDRVVFVGNTTAVSDDLISQLLAAGVDATSRINASSSEAMAAAVASLMAGLCRPELQPATYTVGLVGSNALVDAVAAGPLLGVGLDGSGPIPMLFVRSPLNSSASSFLRTTRTTVDQRKKHATLVAVGGTSAISEAVMNLATRSATTSRALSARISATDSASEFQVTFSEGLIVDSEQLLQRMRDLLYVHDTPAWIVNLTSNDQELGDECEVQSSSLVKNVRVVLRNPLEGGDVIEMRGTDDWFAMNGDRRPLVETRYTVPTPRTTTPKVVMDIIAIAGHTDLVFAIQYDTDEHSGSGELLDMTVDGSRVRILTADETEVDVGNAEFVRAERLFGRAFYRLPLTQPGVGSYSLRNGDLVDLRGGAINVPEGARSGRMRARVSTPSAAFGVLPVRIGPDNPGVDDSELSLIPDEIPNISVRPEAIYGEGTGASDPGDMRIVGKWSGSADGARGNGWTIESARATARLAETASAISRTSHPAVRVWVNTSDRVVTLRYIDSQDREPAELTHGELVGALLSNSAFTRHFEVELIDGCKGEDEPLSLEAGSPFLDKIPLCDGRSSVSFLVRFSDHVQSFQNPDPNVIPIHPTDAGAVTGLIEDVLGGLIPDYGNTADPPVTCVDPPEDRVETTIVLPYDKVLFRFTTADPAHTIGQVINYRRSRIEIAKGIARGFKPDDPDTADVDENENPARIVTGILSRDALLRVGHAAVGEANQ